MNQSINPMYVTFDLESGKILGCSSSKTSNSLAIDAALGEKFVMGMESMHKYKVLYRNGRYTMQKDGWPNPVENVINSKKIDIINENVYKIPNKIENHSGVQIKFYMNQNKIEFTADEIFKKTLESIVSREKQLIHKFYCCELNDATQLIDTLDLNLYELLTQDRVQIKMNVKTNMDIYCRKIFDYSIERIYA
jgi:hypothetical protein